MNYQGCSLFSIDGRDFVKQGFETIQQIEDLQISGTEIMESKYVRAKSEKLSRLKTLNEAMRNKILYSFSLIKHFYYQRQAISLLIIGKNEQFDKYLRKNNIKATKEIQLHCREKLNVIKALYDSNLQYKNFSKNCLKNIQLFESQLLEAQYLDKAVNRANQAEPLSHIARSQNMKVRRNQGSMGTIDFMNDNTSVYSQMSGQSMAYISDSKGGNFNQIVLDFAHDLLSQINILSQQEIVLMRDEKDLKNDFYVPISDCLLDFEKSLVMLTPQLKQVIEVFLQDTRNIISYTDKNYYQIDQILWKFRISVEKSPEIFSSCASKLKKIQSEGANMEDKLIVLQMPTSQHFNNPIYEESKQLSEKIVRKINQVRNDILLNKDLLRNPYGFNFIRHMDLFVLNRKYKDVQTGVLMISRLCNNSLSFEMYENELNSIKIILEKMQKRILDAAQIEKSLVDLSQILSYTYQIKEELQIFAPFAPQFYDLFFQITFYAEKCREQWLMIEDKYSELATKINAMFLQYSDVNAVTKVLEQMLEIKQKQLDNFARELTVSLSNQDFQQYQSGLMKLLNFQTDMLAFNFHLRRIEENQNKLVLNAANPTAAQKGTSQRPKPKSISKEDQANIKLYQCVGLREILLQMNRSLQEAKEKIVEHYLSQRGNLIFEFESLQNMLKKMNLQGDVFLDLEELADELRFYMMIDFETLTKFSSALKLNRLERDIFRKVVLILQYQFNLLKSLLKSPNSNNQKTTSKLIIDRLKIELYSVCEEANISNYNNCISIFQKRAEQGFQGMEDSVLTVKSQTQQLILDGFNPLLQSCDSAFRRELSQFINKNIFLSVQRKDDSQTSLLKKLNQGNLDNLQELDIDNQIQLIVDKLNENPANLEILVSQADQLTDLCDLIGKLRLEEGSQFFDNSNKLTSSQTRQVQFLQQSLNNVFDAAFLIESLQDFFQMTSYSSVEWSNFQVSIKEIQAEVTPLLEKPQVKKELSESLQKMVQNIAKELTKLVIVMDEIFDYYTKLFRTWIGQIKKHELKYPKLIVMDDQFAQKFEKDLQFYMKIRKELENQTQNFLALLPASDIILHQWVNNLRSLFEKVLQPYVFGMNLNELREFLILFKMVSPVYLKQAQLKLSKIKELFKKETFELFKVNNIFHTQIIPLMGWLQSFFSKIQDGQKLLQSQDLYLPPIQNLDRFNEELDNIFFFEFYHISKIFIKFAQVFPSQASLEAKQGQLFSFKEELEKDQIKYVDQDLVVYFINKLQEILEYNIEELKYILNNNVNSK